MPYTFGNPLTFRDLTPLYSEAHKTLLNLFHQKRHKDAAQFIAKFSTCGKGKIRISYSKKDKHGNIFNIFSHDYSFTYKAVMTTNRGKPTASKSMIKVNGKEIDLSRQIIYLDR